ncbi:MAG TPA: hypothetical protein VKC17_10590 [Sphingomicrobium sp.]|nr:hypothetical protein [Sphingomicrobium sp.]
MQHVAKLAILSLVLGAAPASAADPAAKRTAARDQTKYCIQVEPSTGSRISATECRTKAEWASLGVNVDELLAK